MSDWATASQVALESAQRMLGPQPGEVFIALPLEQLQEKINEIPTWKEQSRERFTKQQHIHRCAMINLETNGDELQGRVIDYILANDNVPLFMLNDVPQYLAGYRKAKSE